MASFWKTDPNGNGDNKTECLKLGKGMCMWWVGDQTASAVGAERVGGIIREQGPTELIILQSKIPGSISHKSHGLSPLLPHPVLDLIPLPLAD